MERIALLADIHGNSTALKAVLKDCRQNHIQKFILLGDRFTKGPDPAGVFRQLQRLPTLAAVAGNTDDWLLAAGGLTARQAALTAFTRKELPEPALTYLASLRRSLLLEREGFRIFLSHYPQLPPFSETPDLLICGHTHIPSLFTWENTLSCNPGSIGAPYDRDPRSSYGILTLSAQPGFEIRRISYDTLEELRLAQQKAIPFFSLYEPSIQYGIRSNTPPQATFIKPEAP